MKRQPTEQPRDSAAATSDAEAKDRYDAKAADRASIVITSTEKWYHRLWYAVTNPLCYVLFGYIRY